MPAACLPHTALQGRSTLLPLPLISVPPSPRRRLLLRPPLPSCTRVCSPLDSLRAPPFPAPLMTPHHVPCPVRVPFPRSVESRASRTQPAAVLAFVGPARSGKSSLLGRLFPQALAPPLRGAPPQPTRNIHVFSTAPGAAADSAAEEATSASRSPPAAGAGGGTSGTSSSNTPLTATALSPAASPATPGGRRFLLLDTGPHAGMSSSSSLEVC